ncbi:TIGR04141 family sporadically distributed protein [Azospirillum argentinense]
MPETKKVRTLSIRLLRAGKSPSQSFVNTFASGADRELDSYAWNGIDGAVLYIGQIYASSPDWAKFLATRSPALPEELSSSGAGAALFVPIEGRYVVCCFGHIHIALDDDAFERQFGLKVTLNTVPRGNLRTLDLATPDAITFQKRVQASRDCDVQAFGVDMLRDLARVAGGTPRNSAFAKFVAGKDSLSITCEITPDLIKEKCKEIFYSYNNQEYKRDFSWVDNIAALSEKNKIQLLDKELEKAIGKLRSGESAKLHISPPEIVKYTDGDQIHYNGFGSHGTTFYSLSIEDYISELNRCKFSGNFSEIKNIHKVKSKGENDDRFKEKWRVYDCFVYEATLRKKREETHYVLFSGEWFCVEKEFKVKVEKYFRSIQKVKIIGSTKCRNEQDLIDDVEKNRKDLLKLDQQKINPGGVIYANLEPCDFLSRNGEFIHLKDGHSSGPISHVWMQGVVSVEAFISDPEFRKKLRLKVKSFGRGFEGRLPKSNEKVDRSKYKVVFGIMRKPYADGTLDLPFFSKVSLQAAAQRIDQFGFAIAVELIEKPASDEQ